MKEEFEEEFVQDVEITEEVENEEIGNGEVYELLSEEEEEETTGGAFAKARQYIGAYSTSTRFSTVNIGTVLTKIGVVDQVTWVRSNGARCSWGGGFFTVKRGSKLGEVSFYVYGHRAGQSKNSRYIKCTVNFK